VHDASGPAGINWAVEHSQQVAAIVALNTFYSLIPGAPPNPPEAIRLFSDPNFQRLTEHFAKSPREFRWLYDFQVGGFIRNEDVRQKFVPLFYRQFEAKPSTLEAFLRLNADLTPAVLANTQREPELASFPALVRVAFGELDPYLDPAQGRAIAALFPNAEALTVPGVGHFPQLDAPVEVAQLILTVDRDRRVMKAGDGSGNSGSFAAPRPPAFLQETDPFRALLVSTQRTTNSGEPPAMDMREEPAMDTPPIVSPDEWEAARRQLLVKEKEITRARDALAAERRRMPWMAVEKDYEFDGPNGKASLLDLFDGRRQLIVYRAFFEPGVAGWPEHACVGCSMVADQVAHPAHLNTRDTTLVFASRAPQSDIERVKARMGWEEIPWYTMTDDFDVDFGVDEYHGTNAFIRDGDRVFRTYFINARGDEAMGSTWSYLDITALGRQENWEDSPKGYPQTPPYEWWIWHDEPPETESDRPGLVQLRAAQEYAASQGAT
jgi:predicted dithiol-disulfide oxidoreductase (DUF899 family)